MIDEPEPLDADVLGMLRSALPMTAVPEASRARILSKVEARIAVLPPGGGGHPAGPSVAPPAASLGAAAWIAGHPWLAVTAAFVLGGGAGVLLRGGSPKPEVVYVERPAVTAPSPPAVEAQGPATPPVEAVPVEALPVAPAKPHAEVPRDDTGERLAAESAVLDVARTALAAGDGERALEAVDRHAASFPRGLLIEEREALGIRALVAVGRVEEAKARTARFRTRYPESLFLPAVESSLKSAP